MKRTGMHRIRTEEAIEARIDTDTPSGMLRKRRSSRQRAAVQRSIHYLSGSLIVLLCLMFVSQSINPPDSALVGGQLAPVLGPYDGVWKGKEVSYTLAGQRLEEYESTYDFWSSSSEIQMLTIKREAADESVVVEHFVNKIERTVADGEPVLRSRVADGTGFGDIYRGSVMESNLIWHRIDDEVAHTRRSRLSGNEMHVEELFVPLKDPAKAYHVVGVFTRTVEQSQ